jgi:hypothetical protein
MLVQLGKRYHRRADQVALPAGFAVLLQDVLRIQDTACLHTYPLPTRADITERLTEIARSES